MEAMEQTLQMALPGGRRYPVLLGAELGAGLCRLFPAECDQAAVIADATVAGLYGEGVVAALRPRLRQVALFSFPPGEAHKTRRTKAMLEDRLLSAGFGRQTCVVALGGGVSLDLAGFVAATYLRGVPHLCLPTSLLAMVDAAVGGKTGVNHPRGKNLIGAFHQPRAVVVDPAVLATLPAEQWLEGAAEVVKHGVVADEALLAWVERHAETLCAGGPLPELLPIVRSVEIKGGIVARDEAEAGVRAVLNFGHTVGHGLERAGEHALSHGRAVGAGMVLEGRVAAELCGFPAQQQRRLERLLHRLGLGWEPGCLSLERLWPHLGLDKKRRAGALRMALPRRLGQMDPAGGRYTVEVPREALARAFAAGGAP